MRGGQRGPRPSDHAAGTYRINTALFSVDLQEGADIAHNMVGIVTTKDWNAARAAKSRGARSRARPFEDAQSFIDAGGSKGLQEQVILAGRYYLNPLFATVETVEMTRVPIGYAGEVIATSATKAPTSPARASSTATSCAAGRRGSG